MVRIPGSNLERTDVLPIPLRPWCGEERHLLRKGRTRGPRGGVCRAHLLWLRACDVALEGLRVRRLVACAPVYCHVRDKIRSMYGACRGGNNQPTHHVTPQAIQKMLNAPPNHLKDPFIGPYTTSHRDFKSPRVPAKIGSAAPRHRPISGKSAPFSLRREHCGPLPRGLTQCDRCSRLLHALKLLEPPSLRGWGES